MMPAMSASSGCKYGSRTRGIARDYGMMVDSAPSCCHVSLVKGRLSTVLGTCDDD